ncbi:sugar ABC transporter substrate-binding protein [Mesorhizobium newzealandense]|uniref:Sugar ABC transporter substrate-binding protein n=2 Tax=Mesorhizobium TaxID=68287 RepID=A0ABW4U5H0_9HYPH
MNVETKYGAIRKNLVGRSGVGLALAAFVFVQPASSADGPLTGKTVAYIQTYSNPYYDGTADGVKLAAKSFGASTLVLVSNFDPATERANVQDAITKKVAGVVLEPSTAQSSASNLALLKEAGIPVVVLYGYSPDLRAEAAGFVHVNYSKTGEAAGAALAKALPAGGVGVITGALGRGDAEEMLEGFKRGLRDDSRIVSVVDGLWDRQKAFKAAQDIVTKTPDLKGLFVMNEPMAAGAIQAIGDKVSEITIVSQNGSPEGLTLIKQGTLVATSAWSPVVEGIIATRILDDTLNGKPLADSDKVCLVPYVTVTKDNIAESPSWTPDEATLASAMATKCGRP